MANNRIVYRSTHRCVRLRARRQPVQALTAWQSAQRHVRMPACAPAQLRERSRLTLPGAAGSHVACWAAGCPVLCLCARVSISREGKVQGPHSSCIHRQPRGRVVRLHAWRKLDARGSDGQWSLRMVCPMKATHTLLKKKDSLRGGMGLPSSPYNSHFAPENGLKTPLCFDSGVL